MIYTREELIHKIAYIMSKYWDETPFNYKCAEEIVDLISTLNDEDAEAWKNIP